MRPIICDFFINVRSIHFIIFFYVIFVYSGVRHQRGHIFFMFTKSNYSWKNVCPNCLVEQSALHGLPGAALHFCQPHAIRLHHPIVRSHWFAVCTTTSDARRSGFEPPFHPELAGVSTRLAYDVDSARTAYREGHFGGDRRHVHDSLGFRIVQ